MDKWTRVFLDLFPRTSNLLPLEFQGISHVPQSKFREFFAGWSSSLNIPFPFRVVLVQHLLELILADEMSFGRSTLQRFGQQPLRQGVVFSRGPGTHIKGLCQVVD